MEFSQRNFKTYKGRVFLIIRAENDNHIASLHLLQYRINACTSHSIYN